VLTTALAYLLYARGLRTTPVTTATTLGLAEPAIAAVLGLTLLGEHLTGTGLAGLGVLAVSLAILYQGGPVAGRGRRREERVKNAAGCYPQRPRKAGRHQRGSGPAGHHEGTSRDHEPTWPSRQPLPGWPVSRL
jgi:EamA-like transporter family